MNLPLLAFILAQAAAQVPSKGVPVRPEGNPGAWVTNADYPEAARRAGVQGIVSFRLLINQLGAVEACSIVASSGSVLLDSETCRLLKLRARFVPARGEDGVPTFSNYSGRFRWSIEQSDLRELPFVGFIGTAYVDIFRIVIDEKGRVAECELIAPTEVPTGTGPCAAILASPPVKPFANAEGKPVRKTVIIRREVEHRDE